MTSSICKSPDDACRSVEILAHFLRFYADLWLRLPFDSNQTNDLAYENKLIEEEEEEEERATLRSN